MHGQLIVVDVHDDRRVLTDVACNQRPRDRVAWRAQPDAVEAGAREFGLDFIPVISERYFLICPEESLRTQAVRKIRCDARAPLTVLNEKIGLPRADHSARIEVLQAEKAVADLKDTAHRPDEFLTAKINAVEALSNLLTRLGA